MNGFLAGEAAKIKAAVNPTTGKYKYVYLTGHSLGAAMAQYAAAALKYAGLNITGVYPFASPNTGGPIWQARYT